MLNGLFELIANTLNFFYAHTHNYAIAIALLTCVVMIITTPLTLKGTRSMIEMQRLQPQIRRLQAQYKDDRQKLNEELMAFYKEHQINPVGGCLPLLIQAPVFSILFYVVRGLTRPAMFVSVQQMVQSYHLSPPTIVTPGFRPKYLESSTALYQSLSGATTMKSFGIDLADSPAQALSVGILHALPYLLLVGAIAVLSWFQQKQIMGRTAGAEVTQQQQLMMRIGPLMYVFFTFVSQAAIGIYFLVSTLWRVGQQAFITRSMYRGEDSIGAQAQRAAAELRAEKKKAEAETKGNGAKGNGSKTDGATGTRRKTTATTDNRNGAKTNGAGAKGKPTARPPGRPTAGSAAGSSPAAKPHPRSRKKRKRK